MAITAVLILCSAFSGSYGTSAIPPVQRAKRAVSVKRATATPPTMSFVTMRDPVENAYTMSMPKGWSNVTYLARLFDSTTIVDVSVSPNGSVIIWSGDPSLPGYTVPEAATEMHYFIAQRNKRFQIAPFQTAEQYMPGYVRRKFGKLGGFKVTSLKDDPASANALMDRARREYGMEIFMTVASVNFQYSSGGKTIHAIVTGISGGSMGTWNVSIAGVATTGNPKAYAAMSSAMGKSRKMNTQWQAAQQQKHEQAMAQIRANGAQWTQQGAQAHQARMAAIRAQGDASTKAFYDRMAQGDVQQRNFLNYINDESTMVSSLGKTVQVTNSYERYYYNPQTGKYIGAKAGMSDQELRQLGVTPGNFEELKPRG